VNKKRLNNKINLNTSVVLSGQGKGVKKELNIPWK